jgi:hypothetical protein
MICVDRFSHYFDPNPWGGLPERGASGVLLGDPHGPEPFVIEVRRHYPMMLNLKAMRRISLSRERYLEADAFNIGHAVTLQLHDTLQLYLHAVRLKPEAIPPDERTKSRKEQDSVRHRRTSFQEGLLSESMRKMARRFLSLKWRMR